MVMVNQLVSEVIIKDSASAVEDRIAARADNMAASLRKAGDAVDALSTKNAGSTRTLEASARSFERLKAAADPAYATLQRLADAQVKLQRSVTLGTASQSEANAVYAQLKTQADRHVQALNQVTAAQGQATAGTRNLQFAMTNLSFQVNDVVSGLISGQQPLRILAQQGGQIFQIFQQGGAGFFGQIGASIRGWITPTTLAVAGLAALGGGFLVLLSRAADNAAMIRQFDAVLRGLGPSSQITSTGLQKVAYDLRAIGVSAKDAAAAVSAVGRNPAINTANPQAVAQVIDLGTNVGSLLGIGTEAGIEKTNAAIAAGVPGMVALGLATRAMTADQAAAISIDAARGRQVDALNRAIVLLTKGVEGERARVIAAAEAIKNTLGGAWDHMLNKLSETGPIERANTRLTSFIKGLTYLFEEGKPAPTSRLGVWLGLDKGGPPVDQPRANQRDMADALASRGTPYPVAGPSLSAGGALGLISQYESRNRPLIGWGETDLSGYPLSQTGFPMWPGKMGPKGNSTAAGLYQITRSTWDPIARQLGVTDFSDESQTSVASELYRTRGFQPWAPHNPALRNAIAGRSFGAIPEDARSGFRTGLAGQPPAAAGDTDVAARTTTALTDQQKAVAKLTEAETDNVRIAKEWNIQQQFSRTYTEQYNASLASGAEWWEAMDAATVKANATREIANIELGKATTLKDAETQGVIRGIDAFKISEAAGYSSIAAEEARIKVMRDNGDVATETRLILEAGAASAIQSGQKQVAAALPQVAAAERLADAAKQGGAAQHEAELQAAAATRTQDALAKAEASRNPGLIAQAKALNDAALAEVRRADAAKASLANTQAIRGEGEQQQIMRLQIGLQGETTDAINTQVNLLRTKIELDKLGNSLTDAEKQNRLASVAATGEMTARLAEATREQGRIDDMIRSTASTIDSTLTRPIEDAFNGKKVEDWGAQIKSTLASIASQIASAMFIKPLIGSLLGGLGFNSVAQGFGSLGSLFGGSSGASGGISGGGTLTLTQPGGSTVNLGTLAQGAGLVKDVGGGGLFGGTGSSGGWFNGLGSSLGFATPTVGLSESSITSLGNMIGIEPSSLSYLGNAGTIQGSLFGSTTLGGFLGGAGAGFGAGSLLNSLLGGDPMMGSIGSGFGSLAGSAIGSIFGGPMIGGLLGGAFGSLLGMFGNSKPSNASAGGNIDFSTGRVTGSFSGGNSQIDQATGQAVQSISQFTQNILKASGGTLSGSVLLQNGVNTGFTADSSLTGYEGRFNLGKDATAAVNTVELALARSLTGISDTMKTVINAVSDPAKIEAALQFAGVYDKLDEQFRAAFSSISQDTKTIGPFQAALDQINATFKDLTSNATEFGLSLDPVNAGLAEATKRLNSDFRLSLDQQAAGGSGYLATAGAAHQQFVQNRNDAVALGFTDAATGAKIAAIATAQLGAALIGLDLGQLQKAVTAFAELAPQVSQFAQDMIDAGQYLPDQIAQLTMAIMDPVGLALDQARLAGEERVRIEAAAGGDLVAIHRYNRLVITQIWEQATASLRGLRDELTTGQLSGATIAQQLTAANDNYARELALAQGGNTAEIANLTSAASSLVALSQQAYGNGPQTADARASVLGGIDAVLAQIPQPSATAAPAATVAVPATSVFVTVPAPTVTVTAQVATAPAAVDQAIAEVTTIPIADFAAELQLNDAAAGGSLGTPPGRILVGELGPEWMLPGSARARGDMAGWTRVGRGGPEIIDQAGGAVILPFPLAPLDVMGERAFAAGTDAPIFVPDFTPVRGAAGAANEQAIIEELKKLRAEVAALRQENNNITQGVGVETVRELGQVRGAIEKAGKPPISEPQRRSA